MTRVQIGALLTISVAGLVLAGPLSAHHSIQAQFDINKHVTVSGSIAKVGVHQPAFVSDRQRQGCGRQDHQVGVRNGRCGPASGARDEPRRSWRAEAWRRSHRRRAGRAGWIEQRSSSGAEDGRRPRVQVHARSERQLKTRESGESRTLDRKVRMRLASLSRFAVATAALCLLSAVMIAQESSQPRRTTNAPPKPSGATPRTADGHPGPHGCLERIGRQSERNPQPDCQQRPVDRGDSVTRDLHSGLLIATFPRNTNRPQNNEQAERAAACSGALDPTDLFTSRNTGRWSTTSTTTPTKKIRRTTACRRAFRAAASRRTSASSRRISCSSIPARAA